MKISSLPRSIQTVSTKRPRGLTISKLSVAPTCPRPGPTSFRVVATAVAKRQGQVLLEGHEERRYPEDPDPGREEPEDGDPHGLRNHAPAYLKRCYRPRVDHPEDVLEDRAEDDEDADHLDPARRRTGASSDEHEQDEGDLGGRVPLVEISRYESLSW